MKPLSPGAAAGRAAILVRVMCTLGCVWLVGAGAVRAQNLSVVERSPEDRESADKLSELLREPVLRLHAASPGTPSADTSACLSSAKRELILDSAQHVVKLVRCRDGTTLSRALDPQAAARTPYLGAFIAAELLAIDRELEAVEARQQTPAAQPEAAPASTGPSPDPAATSGTRPSQNNSANSTAATGQTTSTASTQASSDPSSLFTPTRKAPIELRFSAGAELNGWGDPFTGALRPSLALGVAVQPSAAGPSWLIELFASVFGAGEVTRDAERLSLRRSDGQLRIGALYPVLDARLELGGFAFLRGGLTSVKYTGASQVESSQLRWGAGAGLTANLAFGGPFQLYLHALVDLATSRSEYRVAGVPWLKDPAGLLWLGGGLLVHFGP